MEGGTHGSVSLVRNTCFWVSREGNGSHFFATYSPISSPEIEAPYTSEEEQERLLGLYQYLHSRAHNASRPLKTIYYTGPNENLLAWVRWPWAGLDWASLGSRAGAVGAA